MATWFELTGWWQIARVAALLAAPYAVFAAFRSRRIGIAADDKGITVRNMVSTHHVPWKELLAVDFKVVEMNQGGVPTDYRFDFETVGGRDIGATAPGGDTKPDGLSKARAKLLTMRDEALVRDGLSLEDLERRADNEHERDDTTVRGVAAIRDTFMRGRKRQP